MAKVKIVIDVDTDNESIQSTATTFVAPSIPSIAPKPKQEIIVSPNIKETHFQKWTKWRLWKWLLMLFWACDGVIYFSYRIEVAHQGVSCLGRLAKLICSELLMG